MSKNKWHTPASASKETGHSRQTIWRACHQHPGFATCVGTGFKIPDEHIQRVKRGEHPRDIAAAVRAGAGDNRAA